MKGPTRAPAKAAGGRKNGGFRERRRNRTKSFDIAAIKARIDVVEFYRERLPGMTAPKHRSSSSDWMLTNGRCVFHADRKPGSVSINRKSGAYRCFSCGASHGDVISFEMAFAGVDFLEALKRIAGPELPESIRTAPRLPARAALEALEHEALLAEIAARALASGEQLSSADIDRLRQANLRIQKIREATL